MTARSLANSILTHWYFWIALPLAVAVEAAFALTLPWSEYPRAKWAVLFDLCVFLPALHAIVYRKTLSPDWACGSRATWSHRRANTCCCIS